MEIIIWSKEQLKEADNVFISCDKRHRKGAGHFPKIISWYCKNNDELMSIILDADNFGNLSEDCTVP